MGINDCILAPMDLEVIFVWTCGLAASKDENFIFILLYIYSIKRLLK